MNSIFRSTKLDLSASVPVLQCVIFDSAFMVFILEDYTIYTTKSCRWSLTAYMQWCQLHNSQSRPTIWMRKIWMIIGYTVRITKCFFSLFMPTMAMNLPSKKRCSWIKDERKINVTFFGSSLKRTSKLSVFGSKQWVSDREVLLKCAWVRTKCICAGMMCMVDVGPKSLHSMTHALALSTRTWPRGAVNRRGHPSLNGGRVECNTLAQGFISRSSFE